MTLVSKLIYRFNTVPIKMWMLFYRSREPRTHMESQITMAILKSKDKNGGVTRPTGATGTEAAW